MGKTGPPWPPPTASAGAAGAIDQAKPEDARDLGLVEHHRVQKFAARKIRQPALSHNGGYGFGRQEAQRFFGCPRPINHPAIGRASRLTELFSQAGILPHKQDAPCLVCRVNPLHATYHHACISSVRGNALALFAKKSATVRACKGSY